ncbi:MAG: type transport system permease protein [Actinomycetota bacterium]|nr:type transport system permease protein [Actinomycetota bacterium]HQZ84014.1 ABC transporter permease [Actinomycetota bacterium]
MAVVKYERRRIRTIRSTWVILILTLLLTAGVTALVIAAGNIDPETGQDLGDATGDQVMSAVFSGSVLILTLVPLVTLAAIAFGGEYRFGLIRQTLTAFPRRTPVFLAKLLVVVGYIVAFLVLAMALVLAATQVFRNSVGPIPDWTVLGLSMGRALAFAVGYCLFAFALAVITRNQAIAIIIPIVWAVIVESVLLGFLGSRFEWLPKVLPINSGSIFVQGEQDMWQGAGVFLAWILAALIGGWILFTRRDA